MKKALLIGINYVDKPDLKLFGCVNDAMSMRNVLVDAYGYELSNITVLRDDTSETNFKPTHRNIINSLNKLMSESNRCSEIWIHYSGHGTSIRDTNNEESDGKDEVLVPCDYDKTGVIVDDELRKILNNARCRVFLTMDCCNSGTNWDIQYSFPIDNNRIFRNVNNSHAILNKNIFMLAGARDDQYAYDYFNYEMRIPMGAFTMALIDCLRSRNHNVSLLRLYLDIHSYLSSKGFPQNVFLSSSNPLPFVQIQRSISSSSRSIPALPTSTQASRGNNKVLNQPNLFFLGNNTKFINIRGNVTNTITDENKSETHNKHFSMTNLFQYKQ